MRRCIYVHLQSVNTECVIRKSHWPQLVTSCLLCQYRFAVNQLVMVIYQLILQKIIVESQQKVEPSQSEAFKNSFAFQCEADSNNNNNNNVAITDKKGFERLGL